MKKLIIIIFSLILLTQFSACVDDEHLGESLGCQGLGYEESEIGWLNDCLDTAIVADEPITGT